MKCRKGKNCDDNTGDEASAQGEADLKCSLVGL